MKLLQDLGKQFWQRSSLTVKLAVAVVALIAVGIVGTNLSGAISQYRSNQADKRVAAKEKEIAVIKGERDAAIESAKQHEARAEIEAREADALRAVIAQKKELTKQEEAKLNEALEQLKNDELSTGADVPSTVRRERYCRKLAELNRKLKVNIPCE
jgi:uncharacterized membrane protein YdfJ with MMPL/SSD domain